MNPSEHESSKQRGQVLGWKVHNRTHLLFLTRTLFMNYIITMFLFVRYVLYFARFCARQPQNREQKPTTKNFAGFHNHFPLLPNYVNISTCGQEGYKLGLT